MGDISSSRNKEHPKHNALAKRVSLLSGVGSKTADALGKHHIVSVFDLMLRVPKSIVEQEECPGFFHMETGRRYVATGKVVAVKVTGIGARRRLEAILQDDSGRISLIFFGPAVAFAQKILKNDATVSFTGEAKEFLGRIQMVHPKFVGDQQNQPKKLASYSQVGGLTGDTFKRIIVKALTAIKEGEAADHAPLALLDENRMAPLARALVSIHEQNADKMADWDERATSHFFRRVAFEELLSFYVRLNQERGQEKQKPGPAVTPRDVDALAKQLLPFALTNAQRRVIDEILSDMKKPAAMARLLQGDVGSGKTAVSALVAYCAAADGLQVAVMAPTEILAEQLFTVYQDFFRSTSLKIALLTASTKTRERKQIVEQIALNEISIVVGTHALLSSDVQFKKLGLVIIDEQHRFGVKQRAELQKSSEQSMHLNPHLLVMSATPIPRSLALTFYGDLELSIIDERPPGRQKVHTQILQGSVLDIVKKLCERIKSTNQKAFIVFPLVEESEHLDLEHATKALATIQEQFGKDSALMLHGKMKPDEKALAMLNFKNNNISFLISTTVVEVGVDVPDATCMVIVHPERFGLAQLHQLRGRVGRKDLKSFCFLVTDVKNRFGAAFKRLNAMCETDNGFKLAEIDLEIRGPGELLGTKQSGLPNFLIFNYSDFADLVGPAKTYAKSIVQHPAERHLHLFAQNPAHFS